MRTTDSIQVFSFLLSATYYIFYLTHICQWKVCQMIFWSRISFWLNLPISKICFVFNSSKTEKVFVDWPIRGLFPQQKSKHKKTECWFLVNHETLVVYKWVKAPFVFDCPLCCCLISRFLILVRLSCLLSCLSSCLFFCLLSCLVSIILNYVTFRPVLICPMHWTAYFASTQFWSTLINSVISSIP